MAQQGRGTAEKALFVRDTRAVQKLLAWVLASCALLALDAKTPLFDGARAALSSPVGALYFVAEAPYMFSNQAADALASRSALVEKNAELEREILKLQALTSRYDAVHRENSRLRELLGSRTRVRDDVLVAELVGVSSLPQEIIVDKGTLSGVEVGQAVVDSAGVLGQVVETAQFTSRVLLITDPTHSVPVRVLRNDVLSIASGTGDALALKDVAVTLDIVQGDELVSSGLGGRFPPNYPVGVVDSVLRDQTEPFADIVLRPKASVDRTQQVLVVIGTDAQPPPQLVEEAEVEADTGDDFVPDEQPGTGADEGAVSDGGALADEGAVAGGGAIADASTTVDDSASAGDGAIAGESAISDEGATAGAGAIVDDGASPDEGAIADEGATADEGAIADDSAIVGVSASDGDGASAGESANSDEGALADESAIDDEGATDGDAAIVGEGATDGEDAPEERPVGDEPSDDAAAAIISAATGGAI